MTQPHTHRPGRARRSAAGARAIIVLLATAIAVALCGVTPGAQGHSFVWRATKNGGTSIYLLGSVHVLSSDYYPLSRALDEAYRNAGLLVEEVDMGEMLGPNAQMQLVARGLLPSGQSLDQVITAPTRTLVAKAVEELGIPGAALQLLKPWMAAITLDALEWQKAGFDPDLGLDKHFYDAARKDGKPVQGLETLDYQMSLFDGLTTEQQDKLLAETLEELSTEQASVTAAAEAWKTGDTATIERIVLQDLKTDPALYQRLLVARNRAWLPKIEALFSRTQPALVVVGAAHLVGADGLLQMLKARGYAVQQL